MDGTKERILIRRFAIDSFPSLFLIDNSETRKYQGIRAVEQVQYMMYAPMRHLLLPVFSITVQQCCPATSLDNAGAPPFFHVCEGNLVCTAGGVCKERIQGSRAAAILQESNVSVWASGSSTCYVGRLLHSSALASHICP